MDREIKVGGRYRHFKGNEYRVIDLATDSETMQTMVVYQPLYGNHGLWVRPLSMFMEEVDHVKYPEIKQKWRFEEIDEPTDLDEILVQKGYRVCHFQTKEEAANWLDTNIDHKTIGISGSVTVNELEVKDRLEKHNQIFWHQGKQDLDEINKTKHLANRSDVYLTSANALAKTGEIVNIDGACNRISAMNYGPKEVIFIVGKNKITSDVKSAVSRARNVAAPLNARRLNKMTPCIVDGKCHDCLAKDRICRSLNIFWTAPKNDCSYIILLIDEPLGF